MFVQAAVTVVFELWDILAMVWQIGLALVVAVLEVHDLASGCLNLLDSLHLSESLGLWLVNSLSFVVVILGCSWCYVSHLCRMARLLLKTSRRLMFLY